MHPSPYHQRREDTYPVRERAFEIPDSPRDVGDVIRQIHIAAERSPNDYRSGQAFAKPGTFVDPIAQHAFAYVLERMNPNNIDGHMFLGSYELEKEVIAQIARLLGKCDESTMTDGFMLSGGTESMHQVLWMLRNKYFREAAGVSIDDIGVADAMQALAKQGKRPPVILTAVDAHFSTMQKIPALLGLGRDSLRLLPLDENFETSLPAVERIVARAHGENRDILAYVGVFGDTQKGRLENIAAVAETIQRVSNANGRAAPPTVVDAAAQYLFGALMQDSPRHGKVPVWDFRVSSVEAIITDPHKNQIPYACGLLLLRDQALARESHIAATYLSRDLQSKSSSLTDREREDAQVTATIPTSRAGYAAAALWAYNQAHGLTGMRMRKEAVWRLAQDIAAGIRSSSAYELVMDPQSSVVSFRTKDHSGARMAAIYEAINTSPEDRLYISKSTTTVARTAEDLVIARTLGDASPYSALHVHVMEHNNPAAVETLLRRLQDEAKRLP